MNTETVNKNQELEKLIARLFGIPVPAPLETTQNPSTPLSKVRPQINSSDVNEFGSRISENREIVIKYNVGHEKDAEVVINGDAYRCMEDSLAAAYGVGRLVQASISADNDYRHPVVSDISYQKVGQRIVATILDCLADEMLESLRSIAKEVRMN